MIQPIVDIQLSIAVGEVIEAAETAGVTIDSGNVIDLLCDKITDADILDLRLALSTSRYAGRWPKAELKPRSATQL